MLGFRTVAKLFLVLFVLPAGFAARAQPGYQRLAVATRRIDRDRLTVSVYQGGKRVELPRFHELVIVKPLGHIGSLDRLVETGVLLVPSDKRHGEWDVYGEPARDSRVFMPVSQVLSVQDQEHLALPENVYKVKMMIVSSAKNPVVVHAGNDVYRLKPSEALLVLN